MGGRMTSFPGSFLLNSCDQSKPFSFFYPILILNSLNKFLSSTYYISG